MLIAMMKIMIQILKWNKGHPRLRISSQYDISQLFRDLISYQTNSSQSLVSKHKSSYNCTLQMISYMKDDK